MAVLAGVQLRSIFKLRFSSVAVIAIRFIAKCKCQQEVFFDVNIIWS